MPFKKLRKKKEGKISHLRHFAGLFIIPVSLMIIWIVFLESPFKGTSPSPDFVEKTRWFSEHNTCSLSPGPQIGEASPNQQISAVISEGKNTDKVILTLWDQNAWSLLPSINPQQRLVNMAFAVKNRHLVTLQELFLSQSLKIAAYSAHPYFTFPGEGNLIMKRTGLGILSKFRVVSTKYRLFTKATSWDRIANKGVFLARIEHPTLGLIDVYTTHLQASYGPVKNIKTRTRQVEEMIEFIKETRGNNLVLLTGDFNFPEDDPLNAKIVSELELTDYFRMMHPDHSKTLGTFRKSGKRLDYIYYSLPLNWDINTHESEAEIIDLDISDHLGLCAKFVLEKKQD